MTNTSTTIRTSTTTVSSTDIRDVIYLMFTEIRCIYKGFPQDAKYDLDQLQMDLSMLALNAVISAVHLTVVLGSVVVRDYRWEIVDADAGSWGPGADNPPTGPVPAGATIRISVTHNLNIPEDIRAAWFRRLKWGIAPDLQYPDGEVHQIYGTHVSGGYGVTRGVLHNPKFHQEARTATARYTKEEANEQSISHSNRERW